ncbi:prion-inhibition and propagation-domain-containing protein [Poronia punctata]|nr:prion-inhibition and propagation-domain-containing protein [Poronia punctata]
MEVASVTLSAVSPLFQIFSGCIKGYQLFAEANGLEESHKFLRIRFKTEQYRLLDWAEVAGITEVKESLDLSQPLTSILLENLDRQSRLMLRYGRVDERLRPLAKPFIYEESGQLEEGVNGDPMTGLKARFPSTRPLLVRSLHYIEATWRCPTRLRWAISDKAKLEQILTKLTSLNDSLHHLLTDLFLKASPTAVGGDQARGDDTRLSNLARFKGFKYAIDEGSINQDKRMHLGLERQAYPTQSIRLPSPSIQLVDENDYVEQQRVPAWLTSSLSPWKRVWRDYTLSTGDQSALSQPYFSGFEYSRPEAADYPSENPPALAAEDLYRHPAVQGGPRDSKHGLGYKKQHDIYSLGILILEIAYWKPIYQILGYDSAQLIKPSETVWVKEVLLGGTYIKKVKSYMGNTVADILRVSLTGPAAFGVVEDDSDISSAADLLSCKGSSLKCL